MSFESWLAIIIAVCSLVATIFFGFIFTLWQVRTARAIANPDKIRPLSDSWLVRLLRRHWFLALSILALLHNIIQLYLGLISTEPITRATVFFISFYLLFTVLQLAIVIGLIVNVVYDYVHKPVNKTDETK